MKFETTDSFRRDYKKLGAAEHQRFKQAVRKFAAACDQHLQTSAAQELGWPSSLRVKAVEGAPGVWEMTWSFTGPDGRATWEWCTVEIDGQSFRAVRWHRVGRHDIFKKP